MNENEINTLISDILTYECNEKRDYNVFELLMKYVSVYENAHNKLKELLDDTKKRIIAKTNNETIAQVVSQLKIKIEETRPERTTILLRIPDNSDIYKMLFEVKLDTNAPALVNISSYNEKVKGMAELIIANIDQDKLIKIIETLSAFEQKMTYTIYAKSSNPLKLFFECNNKKIHITSSIETLMYYDLDNKKWFLGNIGYNMIGKLSLDIETFLKSLYVNREKIDKNILKFDMEDEKTTKNITGYVEYLISMHNTLPKEKKTKTNDYYVVFNGKTYKLENVISVSGRDTPITTFMFTDYSEISVPTINVVQTKYIPDNKATEAEKMIKKLINKNEN